MNQKSVGVAYILLLLLGYLGVHRFYLGRTRSAVVMLLITLIGGFVLLLPLIGLVVAPFLLGADPDLVDRRCVLNTKHGARRHPS